jgi:hypothetical protein
MTGLEMNERGHGAGAVRIPVVNDFPAVEKEARAAVGVDTQPIVAVDGRNEHPGPANGIILRRHAGTRRNIVPFEVDGGIDALQSRIAG